MTCIYCVRPHVCTEEVGPLCNEHLNNPPPSRLDHLEARLAEVEVKAGAGKGGEPGAGPLTTDPRSDHGTQGGKPKTEASERSVPRWLMARAKIPNRGAGRSE
jgi:hypothetical protein